MPGQSGSSAMDFVFLAKTRRARLFPGGSTSPSSSCTSLSAFDRSPALNTLIWSLLAGPTFAGMHGTFMTCSQTSGGSPFEITKDFLLAMLFGIVKHIPGAESESITHSLPGIRGDNGVFEPSLFDLEMAV